MKSPLLRIRPSLTIYLQLVLSSIVVLVLSVTSALSQSRIVGGTAASIADYPWQVALVQTGESNLNGQFCGGVVIDPFWIVTAAHCVESSNLGDFKVVAGISNLATDEGQEREVAQVIVHPDYNIPAFNNDIALIRLTKPLDLSAPTVKAIPYATAADVVAGLLDPGVMAITTGWGASDTILFDSPAHLQVAEFPIVANEAVATQYERNGQIITPNMISAGFLGIGGVSSCFGDSGGPLVVHNSDSSEVILVGIVSFGDGGCANPNFPGVYARVSAFEDWIKENTGVGLAPPARKDIDIAVLTTELPAGNTLPICEQDSEEIEVPMVGVITNQGILPIASFIVSYVIGQSSDSLLTTVKDTISLAAPLATGCSYVLDEMTFSTPLRGEFLVGLSLMAPNGVVDQAPDNNTSLASFSAPVGQTVTISFTTDAAPRDSRWLIFDSSTPGDPTIIHISPRFFLPNNTYTEKVCLAKGEYIIEMIDLEPDGLEGAGEFQVYVAHESGNHEILRHTDAFWAVSQVALTIPFTPSYNASMEISEPRVQMLTSCSERTDAKLLLTNQGSLPLTHAQIDLNVNGTEIPLEQTFYLASGSSHEISVPQLATRVGENVLSANIATLNQGDVDVVPENNQDNVSFNLALTDQTVNAFFFFNTDDFPHESTWFLLNEQGDTLKRELVIEEINTSVFTFLCQAEGCYELRINDSFADGSLQDTAAQIILGDGTPVMTIEGNFNRSASKSFCLIVPPANLTASSQNQQALLNWEDHSDIESGYVIERSLTSAENFEVIDTVAANTTTYIDTTVMIERTYTYRVKAHKGNNTSSRANEAEVQIITSLDKTLAGKLEIFPNPASQQLYINWEAHAVLNTLNPSLRVIDMQGRISIQQTLGTGNQHVIPTSALSNGMYLLQLITPRGILQRKLVIHHQ